MRLLIISSLLVSAVALSACGDKPLSVSDALSRCGQPGNDVRVLGRVAQVYEVPIFDGAVYRFVDDLDSVWVISRHPAPQRDREMVVRGSVAESSKFSKKCKKFLDSQTVCNAVASIIGLVAGDCILFEDRREKL